MRRILPLILFCACAGSAALLIMCSSGGLGLGGSETDAKVWGVAYFADGTPAFGAKILSLTPDNTLGHVVAVADASGKFSFRIANPGVYLFKATGIQDSIVQDALFTVEIPQHADTTILIDPVYLKANGFVKGCVTDFASYPGANYAVILQYQGFIIGKTNLDSQGCFTLSGAEGTYNIVFHPLSPGYMSLTDTIAIAGGITTQVTIASLPRKDVVVTDSGYIADTLIVRAMLDSMGLMHIAAGSVIDISRNYRVAALRLARRGIQRLPSLISALPQLELLDLFDNSLTALPPAIGACSRLKTLIIDSNYVGALPREIGMLDSLTTLRASNNRLRELPPEIGDMRNLRELWLANNELISLPAEIGSLKHLETLAIGGNRIAKLPAEIGGCASLQVLTAQNNLLDSLPASMARCVRLIKLYAKNNRLTRLPDSLGKLTALEYLNIDNNLAGSLPATTGQMRSLRYLIAPRNRLASIPAGIAKLGNLVELNLDSNRLESIPESLTSLSNLAVVRLRGNFLCSLSISLEEWLTTKDPSWRSAQACGQTSWGGAIMVLSPNGGEVFTPGQTMRVRWNTLTGNVFTVFVFLILDDLNAVEYRLTPSPIESGSPQWENFQFVIPETIEGVAVISDRCLIRVKDYMGMIIRDDSDAPFAIVPWTERPPLRLIAPAGGEAYHPGSTLTLQWETLDADLYAVACSLSIDNGVTWKPIPGAGSISTSDAAWERFSWTLPDSLAGQPLRSAACRVKISDFVGCGLGPVCRYDVSDGVFTIE